MTPTTTDGLRKTTLAKVKGYRKRKRWMYRHGELREIIAVAPAGRRYFYVQLEGVPYVLTAPRDRAVYVRAGGR